MFIHRVDIAHILDAVAGDNADCAVSKTHPAATQGMRKDATQAGETQKAFLSDVGDHDADLVHVGGDHDLEWVGAIGRGPLVGDEIAHRIDSHFVNQRFNQGADEVAHPVFETGWAIGFHEGADEVVHGVCVSPKRGAAQARRKVSGVRLRRPASARRMRLS